MRTKRALEADGVSRHIKSYPTVSIRSAVARVVFRARFWPSFHSIRALEAVMIMLRTNRRSNTWFRRYFAPWYDVEAACSNYRRNYTERGLPLGRPRSWSTLIDYSQINLPQTANYLYRLQNRDGSSWLGCSCNRAPFKRGGEVLHRTNKVAGAAKIRLACARNRRGSDKEI